MTPSQDHREAVARIIDPMAFTARSYRTPLLDEQLDHRRLDALTKADAIIKLQVGEGWRAIESAPKGRKVLAGYLNELGNWRTVMATYYLPVTLEASDSGETDDAYASEGWYEESETHDEILPCYSTPTHWQPLPAPPTITGKEE